MSERDPRVDPMPGDILRRGGMTLEVDVREGDVIGHCYRHDGEDEWRASGSDLALWIRCHRDAEVLHVAGAREGHREK